MITLDIEEDNSEILEYILKVGCKFYPMVYENHLGIMQVGGTKVDEAFEYFYNRDNLGNILPYYAYLNDEEIQAHIKAFNLDVDKFYLLILFVTHASRGQWENPDIKTIYPYTQVEAFCKTIIQELQSISDNSAEFSNEATITLKIGKKKIVVSDATAITYIGTMTDKMFDMVKRTRKFHAKGYKSDFTTQEENKKERDSFYEKLNTLASPNIYTYNDAENKKEVTVNYNEALFCKGITDLDNLYDRTSTYQTYLIGHFASMLDYFLKSYTSAKKDFIDSKGCKRAISKYRLIYKLIGLTKLTQYKKIDEDFLYDTGEKVKGYITSLKKAKIKTSNKFYEQYY